MNISIMWKGANRILAALTAAGYEAFIIGGAVRDIVMKREPHDFDIVTSARPDTVVQVMERNGYKTTGLVGKSFGVVVVITPEGHYEVATYRREQYGKDSHRPTSVAYADSLEEDVKRRDFTVNGMAMNETGHIIDLVGGVHAISHKRLETIGDPHRRFQEDALRLFRACRFAARLDFSPSESLVNAMPSAFSRVEGLSLERVKAEIETLLLEPFAEKGLDLLVQSRLGNCACKVVRHGQIEMVPILPELYHLVNLPQEKRYHEFDGWHHTLAVVHATQPDLILRWAALLHDVGKGLPEVRGIRNGKITDWGHDEAGAVLAQQILLRFGYDKKFVSRVVWLVQNHMRFHYFVSHPEANAEKWMRKEANSGSFRYSRELQEACEQQSKVCVADIIGTGKSEQMVDDTVTFGKKLARIAKSIPIHTRDLQYDRELLTVMGDRVGELLPHVLHQVQSKQVKNTPEALMHAVKRKLMRDTIKQEEIENGE